MPARGDRLPLMESTKLQRELTTAVGTASVYQRATEWGIPHWILRDTLSGKIDCPSPKYLRQIAKGLGWTVEEVIDAALSVPA